MAGVVRLTATGIGLALGGACLVLAGLLLGLAGPLAIGLAAMVAVVAAAVVVWEAPNVEVERIVSPAEVDRGSPSTVTLSLRGTSDRPRRRFSVVETVGQERRIATLRHLGVDDVVVLTVDLDTSARGWVQTGPLDLIRRDVLGLAIAVRTVDESHLVAVRPRRHPIRVLPSRHVITPTASRHLHELVPGDSLRRVHWRSTSRSGRYVVGHDLAPQRPELVVLLDTRAAVISSDDFEVAVEIAASLLRAGGADGFATRLALTTSTDAELSDLDQLLDLDRLADLDRLTQVGRVDESDPDLLPTALAAASSPGANVVVVTGELGADDLLAVGAATDVLGATYLVSIARDRRDPFHAPPGTVGIACADSDEFISNWAALR